MKVLVTGSSGFIGQELCSVLHKYGLTGIAAVRHEVPRLDNNVSQFVVGDIDARTDWSEALNGADAVVHLAARAHVMHETLTDPLAVYRAANTDITLNLASQAAGAGVRRFVFASTIKVNGEGRVTPYTETDPPAPQDAYALSKWEAEQGLREIAAQTGLEVVILRFPLVYGPGVGTNFLKLLRAVEKGLPLPLGRIHNRRSLIYLGNLVDAIAACLTHPAAANKTFLLSDGEDVSTPQLIQHLAEALGRPRRLLPVPEVWLRLAATLVGKRKEVDRLLGSLCVDSSAIHQELGWEPPCSMQEGLMETAAWFKAYKALPSG